jgi:hypothetical protein
MSIQNKIRVIKRVDEMVNDLTHNYPEGTSAYPELKKMHDSLEALLEYLAELDQLKPNYTTNEIDKYMLSITTNLDILHGELQKADYLKLSRGVKVLKTILKFHPAKYSWLEFVVIWVYEMIYFI